MRFAGSFLTMVLPGLALAQEAGAPADVASSQFASLVPLLVIFAIFYVLLIRPQQKRMKDHQHMLTQLVKGDEIVTAGGIVGKITKNDAGDTFTVEIASGVEVKVVKSTVTAVLGKTPVATPKKEKGANKNDNIAGRRDNVANDN